MRVLTGGFGLAITAGTDGALAAGHRGRWMGLGLGDLKRSDGPELRTVGSLSLVRQLLEAGLVDRLKLVICPLVLPQTGNEPTFAGLPDLSFDLVSTTVLDGRVLLLEYRPTGQPPYSPE